MTTERQPCKVWEGSCSPHPQAALCCLSPGEPWCQADSVPQAHLPPPHLPAGICSASEAVRNPPWPAALHGSAASATLAVVAAAGTGLLWAACTLAAALGWHLRGRAGASEIPGSIGAGWPSGRLWVTCGLVRGL